MSYRFTHMSGANEHRVDTVQTMPVVLGRDDMCHVRLDKHKEVMVSGKHAQIDEVGDGQFTIANLSRNGTFVNGMIIEEQAPLPNHATIQLGQGGPRLRFDYDVNVGGVSFADMKREKERQTAKRDKKFDLSPMPETEERPIFKLDDEEPPPDPKALDPVKVVVIIVGVLAVVIALVLYFVLR